MMKGTTFKFFILLITVLFVTQMCYAAAIHGKVSFWNVVVYSGDIVWCLVCI